MFKKIFKWSLFRTHTLRACETGSAIRVGSFLDQWQITRRFPTGYYVRTRSPSRHRCSNQVSLAGYVRDQPQQSKKNFLSLYHFSGPPHTPLFFCFLLSSLQYLSLLFTLAHKHKPPLFSSSLRPVRYCREIIFPLVHLSLHVPTPWSFICPS